MPKCLFGGAGIFENMIFILDLAKVQFMGGEVDMENLALTVEEFLFGGGLKLQNYFIEQTPVSEVLCYRNTEGREFDLLLDDEALAAGVFARLKELNVRIVCLEWPKRG